MVDDIDNLRVQSKFVSWDFNNWNCLFLIKDKVSRRPGVETDVTTRAIYNESTCALSGQLRFLSPFPLDAESGSPDTWTALLGKRPSSVRRSKKL